VTRGAWIAIGVVVALWAILLGLLGVVAIVSLGGGGGRWEEHVLQGDGRRKIAVINVTGEIHGGESAGGFSTSAGAADVISQLEQAAEDDVVEAIILRLDTPGGAVVASDDIARAVRRVREDVPVVASMADVSASGGYYVASQAERIVASPATITGSIGVIAILPNLEGTADKLGIKPVVLKSGELKDVGSPFKAMTPEERDLYQRLLDEAHNQFIGSVASGRGMPEDEVRELADGRPYSGEQAKANGLVDELGDLDHAFDVALDLAGVDRDDARLVELRASRGLGDFFGFGIRSPTEEIKEELGIGLGLQYLYLP
jgi:protease-4